MYKKRYVRVNIFGVEEETEQATGFCREPGSHLQPANRRAVVRNGSPSRELFVLCCAKKGRELRKKSASPK